MSDKVTFRISAAAAPYVGADKPLQDRLDAAAGKVDLPPGDLVLLIYYLCHDPDPQVKRTAIATLRALDASLLTEVLADPQLHPRILEALVQLHGKNPQIASLFASHPMLSVKAAAQLAAHGAYATPEASLPAPPGGEAGTEAPAVAEPATVPDEDEPLDEEEYQSKYQMAQAMGVSERIKAALTGDKEWRGILIKDNNKLVSGAVIKNPRITDGEVLTIAKSAVQNDEIMRVICQNKEWIKNPLIRKALVENNKTPLPYALRFVGTLSEKDLSSLAKSKNISSVIASQARKLLTARKEKR